MTPSDATPENGSSLLQSQPAQLENISSATSSSSYQQRHTDYTNIIASSLISPILLETEADRYLTDHPFTSGAFYPSDPIITARSIALTNSLFYVSNSKLVPGEKGLFTRSHMARREGRTFVGFYTGWLHPLHHPSPYSADRAYSLHLTPLDYISTASDDAITRELKYKLFPLASANEWIWDPDSNLLQFDRYGKTYLSRGPKLAKGTEVTVCLGIRGEYSWGHNIYHLYQRLTTSLIQLANIQHQHTWSEYITSHCNFPSHEELSALEDDVTTRTLSHVLYALIVDYSAHSTTASLVIQPHMTLLTWVLQLAHHGPFMHQHGFRKADHPKRSPYTIHTILDIYARELILSHTPTQPLVASTRPRRLLPIKSMSEADEPHYSHSLYVETTTSAAMRFTNITTPTPLFVPGFQQLPAQTQWPATIHFDTFSPTLTPHSLPALPAISDALTSLRSPLRSVLLTTGSLLSAESHQPHSISTPSDSPLHIIGFVKALPDVPLDVVLPQTLSPPPSTKRSLSPRTSFRRTNAPPKASPTVPSRQSVHTVRNHGLNVRPFHILTLTSLIRPSIPYTRHICTTVMPTRTLIISSKTNTTWTGRATLPHPPVGSPSLRHPYHHNLPPQTCPLLPPRLTSQPRVPIPPPIPPILPTQPCPHSLYHNHPCHRFPHRPPSPS